jgi:hypothetical protein
VLREVAIVVLGVEVSCFGCCEVGWLLGACMLWALGGGGMLIGCGIVAVMIWAVCRWPVLLLVADSLMLEEADPPIGLPPGWPVAGSRLWSRGP